MLVADVDDDLDDADVAALHAALAEAEAEAARGETIDANDVIAKLRARG